MKLCVTLACLVSLACGSSANPVSPSAMLAPSDVVATTAPPVAIVAPLVNCDQGKIVAGFSLGQTTIINHSACANDFTFAAFRITDPVNPLKDQDQYKFGQVSARLAAGESRTLTLALPTVCGMRIQQDVWVGVDPRVQVRVSTGERWWSVERGPACEVTIPPPVVTSPPPPVPPVVPPVQPPVTPPVTPPVEPPVDMCIKDPLWCQPMPPPEPPTQDKPKCNQGRGNGPEGCDPGNSNHNQPSNDEGDQNREKGGKR